MASSHRIRCITLLGWFPLPLLQSLNQPVDRFANREIEHLAVESRVVTRRAAETNDLAITQGVLARALNGIDDLGGEHIHDVQRHLGIGHLLFAAAEDAEQLLVTYLFPSEFYHVARNGDVRSFEGLLPAFQLCLAGNLFQIIAIRDVEPAGFLEMA